MTSGSKFAPNPGQLNEIIVKRLQSKTNILDPADAWTQIERVMKSGDMHYEPSKAFKSLPEIVQKAIGSTSILREWSLMDYDKLVWVKKDFTDRLKELQDKESKRLAEPQNLLRLLSGETTQELPEVIEEASEAKPMHINDIMREMFGREEHSLTELMERLRNAG